MVIEYKTKKYEKICTNFSVAKKEYGKQTAIELYEAIYFLTAAENVDELLQPHFKGCHKLAGNRKGQYSMHLKEPFRLVFTIREKLENYLIIQIARIEEIIDYH